MKLAIEKARQVDPTLSIGVCGEVGGDPASIPFLQEIGVTYVSCSPYRVPAARLAVAQAALPLPLKQLQSSSNILIKQTALRGLSLRLLELLFFIPLCAFSFKKIRFLEDFSK